MTVTVNPSESQSGRLVIKIDGALSTANGGLGAVLNPEGVDLIITRSHLFYKAASAGAANLGAGIVAAAASKGTDVVNDLASAATAGKVYNGSTIQVTAKTEVTAPVVWQAGYYLTFTGSASTVGMVAYLYVEYLRLP
jgi:hypothetical protein